MNSFWDWFWLMVWWFVFFMYLILLFQICADLFRDKATSGWAKAFWVIGLIVFPFLIALIYIIARGKGMAERQTAQIVESKAATDAYIRQTANASPAAAITEAKNLLDAGVIDQAEFAQLKAKALA
ncbi:membrane protein [Cellulomonas chitinilytica]|uniref:Membrane protein n=1 Tax=Cellulomonas chitinilytica TaxID=398759 RepID=A0A919P9N1_9CELL|nr:SHOCT domain-containing protein [Cellulomonas chitinilytica]GIG23429.1 membrane protein [Cellulomonas chitinilytica]